MSFYSEMERRFSPVRVLVDGTNEVPSHVWYQLRAEKHAVKARMYKFSKELSGPKREMELHSRKWRYPKGRDEAYIKLANLHIDELAKHLHFADRRWLRDNEMPLPDPNAIENLLGILNCSYERAVPEAFIRDVSAAFCHSCHNSCVREGLRAILAMAGKIAFGVNFPKNSTETFFSIGGGTSQYRNEGLPIQVIPSPAYETFGFGHPRSTSPESDKKSTSSCSSTSSQSSSTSCSMIYCDTVVTSIDPDGWTKFLLVTEVKSGVFDFTGAETAQIVRQMIALCMHQTEVFGLLINGGGALLLGLTHDQVTKRLQCYKTFEYPFKSEVGDEVPFNAGGFKKFIRDLVVVLDYAKENIRKVELQLDPL